MNSLFPRMGVVLGLSLAGFFFSEFCSWSRRKASTPPASTDHLPSSSSASFMASDNGGSKTVSRGGLIESGGSLAINHHCTSTTINATAKAATTASAVVELSPTSRSSGHVEGILSPELVNALFEQGLKDLCDDIETFSASPTAATVYDVKEQSLMEEDMSSLLSLLSPMPDGERSLEVLFLKLQGRHQKEAAMKLKDDSFNTILYYFSIKSLYLENRSLQSQLVDHTRVKNELEDAEATIKLIRKKMESDAEQAKENMAFFRERLSFLQLMENKNAEAAAEIEEKSQKLKELENEAAELRMKNLRLAEENTDLAKMLETLQTSQSSFDPQAEEPKETNHLREADGKLMQDTEQLRMDQFADVEELVYLRWLNACLRYESRNCKCLQGRTVARDLNKCSSPKSAENVKHLILEYANSSAHKRSSSLVHFDSDYSSSSRIPSRGSEITRIDASTAKFSNSGKAKLIHKLKKLAFGKGANHDKASSVNKKTITSTSCDDAIERIDTLSYEQQNRGFNSDIELHKTPDCTRATSIEARMIGEAKNRSLKGNEINTPEKIKLKIYADALIRSKEESRLCQR